MNVSVEGSMWQRSRGSLTDNLGNIPYLVDAAARRDSETKQGGGGGGRETGEDG